MRKTVRHLQTLVRSRHLVIMWTGRTIKGRYQQSVLGWLWAVIQPAATAALFTVVFTYIVPVNTGHTPYLAFSFAAVVPWTFLAMSLSDMSASLVTNMGLITKIYFPREVLPIAAMCSRLMDFGLAFVVLGVLLLLYDLPPSLSALLYLPVIVGIQLTLVLGIGIACAAANVFYRDTEPLLRLVVQLWFYASPIIYSVSAVPIDVRPYYFVNPMAGIIEAYRDVLLRGVPPGAHLWVSGGMGVGGLVAGYVLFKRLESRFADVV
jgi:lipopolysaccharide transport system permease protein